MTDGPAENEIDTKKKTLKYKERDPDKRMDYLQKLRGIIAGRGSRNIVYVDESGFEPDAYRPYGWGPRGQKVHGERSGHRRPRTSLIAARRGQDFLAPMIFPGTANSELVNDWVEQMLCKELYPNSTLVFDNAAFHKKKDLKEIAKDHGHHVLFLPSYSPDFNPIEHDFANIKKRRQYASENTPLEEIIKNYGN